jgi:hypothetical protein
MGNDIAPDRIVGPEEAGVTGIEEAKARESGS